MPLDFSSGRKPLLEFSLASMTDIVMLLLIFFLLTSSFATQNTLPVNLPNAAAATPLEEQFVAVTIQADGRFFVEEAEVEADELLPTLNAVRGTRTGVAVYADEAATVGQLAAVASAASALEMRVAMATDPLSQGDDAR
ncbi:MAG TPA: biopolymer transporter ExbD [Rubricoccaceae bacterium]|nr:biopolymer transporter ExbD [Rubricoccaceae bacterium]